MTLKENFVNALAVYKKNFAKLFVPLLIMQLLILLPMTFFTMPGTVNALRALLSALTSFSRTGDGLSSSILPVFAYILLMLLFFSLIIVSNTVFVVDKDFHDKPVTFRQSLGFARGNYGSMIKSYFAAVVWALPIFAAMGLVLASMFIKQFDIAFINGFDQFLSIASLIAFMLYTLGTVFVPYVVVAEEKSGFRALKSSFRYIYGGHFLGTVGRLALGAGVVGAMMLLINWLAQLPFAELFDLYLRDPAAAFKEPLMILAIVLAVGAIFLVALIIPFWYAFSYNTYRGAREYYAEKTSLAN